MSALTKDDLEVGGVYKAKRPKRMFFGNDNRIIMWISGDKSMVQYDSNTVAMRVYRPIVSVEQFLRWCGERAKKD